MDRNYSRGNQRFELNTLNTLKS